MDVFRPADEAPRVAKEAAEIGAPALWLQLGIRSDEARRIAEEAGMDYVEDRCTGADVRRFGITKARNPLDGFAENPVRPGVHGDDPIAGGLQLLRDAVRGLVRVGRAPDLGDRIGLLQHPARVSHDRPLLVELCPHPPLPDLPAPAPRHAARLANNPGSRYAAIRTQAGD